MATRIIHNSDDGVTVGAAKRALRQVDNNSDDATAIVGRDAVDDDRLLRDGDVLEFVRVKGTKGLGELLTPDKLRSRWEIDCDQYDELCSLGLPSLKFRNGDVRHPEAAVDEFLRRLTIGPEVASERQAGASDVECNRPKRKIALDNNEANFLVRKYLKKNHRATIRQVSAATDISIARIANLDAWRQIMDERNAVRPPPKRSERPLTDEMLASIGTYNDPSTNLIDDDEVFRKIIESATPEERAQLNNKSSSERASLIEAARQHFADVLVADGRLRP